MCTFWQLLFKRTKDFYWRRNFLCSFWLIFRRKIIFEIEQRALLPYGGRYIWFVVDVRSFGLRLAVLNALLDVFCSPLSNKSCKTVLFVIKFKVKLSVYWLQYTHAKYLIITQTWWRPTADRTNIIIIFFFPIIFKTTPKMQS